MKMLKKTILFLLTMVPIGAISHAAEFGWQIEAPQMTEQELEAEFLRRLSDGLLAEKYYNFLYEHDILSYDAFASVENAKLRERVLRQFRKELNDIVILASSANSFIPE